MSFVAIDLGASSSRSTCNTAVIDVLANNMVMLPTMEQTFIVPDSSDIESSLEVQIIKEEADSMGYFPANVLIGIMAERHRNMDERPNVNSHKHVQRINYISAVVACAINKIKQNLEDEIDVYIAVPPIEVHEAQAAFEKDLIGTYTVKFPKYNGGTEVKFKIASVHTYEESHMAATSFFFNMNGVPKEQSRKYLAGNVLSLDIGASTTDLAIIKNGRYLDKSGQTYRIGGNVARDNLIDGICARYAMDLPVADAEKVMSEGRVQQGNLYEDVHDLVDIAKADLAKQLTVYMQTYFKRVNIPIQTINAIVVSGGGSMQSQYANTDGEIIKTSEPMSYFVTNELTTWSKGTEVVEYGDEARFANVRGLYIRAKIDEMKKKQAMTASQPVVKQPAQAQPAQAQPAMAQPTMAQPTMAQPAMAQPTMAQPTQAPVAQPVQPQVVQTTPVQ